ncbi:MAG: hypothetical protein HGA65_09365, partial [Oscillochloris sp.]|nr:hypothetical protein [Oscillochloris sp.]
RVWHDRNANGVQDPSEPGIANVTVTLYQPGSDGAIGGGDDIQVGTSFTTDANGNYLFTGLVPGTYYVAFDMPTGYDAISPQHIGTSESDSDADQSTRLTSLITLGSGSIDRSSDMGVYQRARIGQRVWEDSDHNGVFDTGEDGVAGVTVSLYTGSGSLVITRTTDTNGDFFFDDLNPGEYYLVFDRPGGWTISPQNHGSDDNIDSDADPLTGQTQHITLASGAEDLSWWMGISRPATAITLLSFRVTHQTSGNMLKWETGSEMRSAGFEIYRSTTGSRADAELISGSRIPTRGVGGGGAQYQWMDSSANIKVDYTYWLVEIEIGGARKEYEQQAPTLQQIWSTFLPQVAR